MTTGGEGGMVTTNSEELWKKMWSFKDHGKSYDAVHNKKHPPGFRWLHDSFGSNYRMTEMQAAIGLIQLERMASWSETRRSNAGKIWQRASEFEALRVPKVPEYIQHAAYKAYVFVEQDKLKPGWDRDRVMAEINCEGVPCFSGSCSEVYLEHAFDNTGFRPDNALSVAKELGETALMFLVHPTLSEAEIQHVCETLTAVMSKAQH
jgi:dTDP-4-amino-4,6-dideoxygalactose transaminase